MPAKIENIPIYIQLLQRPSPNRNAQIKKAIKILKNNKHLALKLND